MRGQSQEIITQFKNLNINLQVHIMDYQVKNLLRPFEENINPGEPQGKFFIFKQ